MSQPLYENEILLWLPDNRRSFYITTAPLTNVSFAAVIPEVLGLPVKESGGDYLPLQSTDEANVSGIVVGREQGAPSELNLDADEVTTYNYFILTSGDAQIAKKHIHANDSQETAFDTVAEIITALEALGIKCVEDPTQTTTQTT